MSKQGNTLNLAPSSIFERIYAELRSSRTDIHLDGSSDFQRGFFEGFDFARRVIEVEEGNITCQVAANET